MPNCTFLVGIPLSGKSTYAVGREVRSADIVLSRDRIREGMCEGKYKFRASWEPSVTEYFNMKLDLYASKGLDLIVDNTNCRVKNIKEILVRLPDGYKIFYMFFPISRRRAYIRNILRFVKTRKWIPFKVIDRMYINYKNTVKTLKENGFNLV